MQEEPGLADRDTHAQYVGSAGDVGRASNSSNTVNLELTIDSNCRVSGSGVSCTWFIDNTGKVTGSGSFAFVSGSYLTVAASSWSLQMSTDKKSMTGTMEVAYPTLHGMSVTVTKQRGGA